MKIVIELETSHQVDDIVIEDEFHSFIKKIENYSDIVDYTIFVDCQKKNVLNYETSKVFHEEMNSRIEYVEELMKSFINDYETFTNEESINYGVKTYMDIEKIKCDCYGLFGTSYLSETSFSLFILRIKKIEDYFWQWLADKSIYSSVDKIEKENK